ncbi:TPA: Arc family DNA-binding protein [Salmonella enterica subsp. enterica serovar Orion]|nr:Arc family DNA-binding protein [Salmonella enterica]EBV0828775.1 DNA-binding protein [Salmonella enterica subsp. enterica serovar Bredeney]ECA5038836.1 Arc family DNA-binding protein [Salmonella enterica subsp. enterica serovar Oranienburg]ECG1797025.1 Arc family DNA-binding protein [Salmonella enterica subsp. enterica serovar Orion]HDN4591614.1 Arc family DNA-binding protein [Salmonella enterica subsp. enterica serovar Bahrenfeld]
MKGASLIAPFGLRMPEELKEKIAKRAKTNGRSMNAEIVQILEDALKAQIVAWDKPLSPSSSDEVVTMSMSQLNKIVSIAAEDTAKSVVENLIEKYEMIPKKSSKPNNKD